MQPGLAQGVIQMRGHGLQLPLNLAGCDDQAVRIVGAARYIQNQDVLGLVIFKAFARRFDEYFQPVGCQFFAALTARAADPRGCRLRFAIGLG